LDHFKRVARFVGEALRLESLTPQGRINFGLMALALVLVVVPASFTDWAQALIRGWKPTYSADLPSGFDFFIAWLVATILCIAVVAAGQRPGK
jgi:hypothetical protein